MVSSYFVRAEMLLIITAIVLTRSGRATNRALHPLSGYGNAAFRGQTSRFQNLTAIEQRAP